MHRTKILFHSNYLFNALSLKQKIPGLCVCVCFCCFLGGGSTGGIRGGGGGEWNRDIAEYEKKRRESKRTAKNNPSFDYNIHSKRKLHTFQNQVN